MPIQNQEIESYDTAKGSQLALLNLIFFLHLKDKSWVNMHMKVDTQIVKLRQKTNPSCYEYFTSFFRKWLTKFWSSVGMWQIGVVESGGSPLTVRWNPNLLIWIAKTYLLVLPQLLASTFITYVLVTLNKGRFLDCSLLYISISSRNSACHLYYLFKIEI